MTEQANQERLMVAMGAMLMRFIASKMPVQKYTVPLPKPRFKCELKACGYLSFETFRICPMCEAKTDRRRSFFT